MVQYRIFTGSLQEIEAAFNAWAASLVQGVSVNHSPIQAVGDGTYLKEVVYVLPLRSNNSIAIPKLVHPENAN